MLGCATCVKIMGLWIGQPGVRRVTIVTAWSMGSDFGSVTAFMEKSTDLIMPLETRGRLKKGLPTPVATRYIQTGRYPTSSHKFMPSSNERWAWHTPATKCTWADIKATVLHGSCGEKSKCKNISSGSWPTVLSPDTWQRCRRHSSKRGHACRACAKLHAAAPHKHDRASDL